MITARPNVLTIATLVSAGLGATSWLALALLSAAAGPRTLGAGPALGVAAGVFMMTTLVLAVSLMQQSPRPATS